MNQITPLTKFEKWLYRNPTIRWLPVILWMVLIFLVSDRESTELPHFGWWDFLAKKLAHMVAYALLAVFAHWGTQEKRWALVLTILYAISDEWHQTFVPGRNGTITDVLIDSVGAIIGLWAYHRWFYRIIWARVQMWLLSNRL